MYCQDRYSSFFQEVKGLTKILYAYALDRTEICLHASSLELWLVRFVFSKEEDEESVKIMFYLYFVPCGINFIQFFACSYFLTCSPP